MALATKNILAFTVMCVLILADSVLIRGLVFLPLL